MHFSQLKTIFLRKDPNLLHFPQIAYKALLYIMYGPEQKYVLFGELPNWLIHYPLSIVHFPFQDARVSTISDPALYLYKSQPLSHSPTEG